MNSLSSSAVWIVASPVTSVSLVPVLFTAFAFSPYLSLLSVTPSHSFCPVSCLSKESTQKRWGWIVPTVTLTHVCCSALLHPSILCFVPDFIVVSSSAQIVYIMTLPGTLTLSTCAVNVAVDPNCAYWCLRQAKKHRVTCLFLILWHNSCRLFMLKLLPGTFNYYWF